MVSLQTMLNLLFGLPLICEEKIIINLSNFFYIKDIIFWRVFWRKIIKIFPALFIMDTTDELIDFTGGIASDSTLFSPNQKSATFTFNPRTKPTTHHIKDIQQELEDKKKENINLRLQNYHLIQRFRSSNPTVQDEVSCLIILFDNLV